MRKVFYITLLTRWLRTTVSENDLGLETILSQGKVHLYFLVCLSCSWASLTLVGNMTAAVRYLPQENNTEQPSLMLDKWIARLGTQTQTISWHSQVGLFLKHTFVFHFCIISKAWIQIPAAITPCSRTLSRPSVEESRDQLFVYEIFNILIARKQYLR